MGFLGEKIERKWKVYIGGVCEPFSPGGVAAYGFHILNDFGTQFSFNGSGTVAVGGPEAMVDFAEYMALLKGLAEVDRLSHPGDKIEVFSDSQLFISQVTGQIAIAPSLQPFYERATSAIHGFKMSSRPVGFTWIHPSKRYGSEARWAKNAIKDAGKADPEILKKLILTLGEHEGKALYDVPASYYEWLWTNQGGEVLIPYRPVD